MSLMTTESLQKRGMLFDLAAFLANLLLAGPLIGIVRKSGGIDPIFAWALLAAGIFQAAGAYFKRRPLHARLAAQPGQELGGGGYLLFLVLSIMHYAVFMACIMAALEGFGLNGKLGAAEPFLAMGGALIPTTMAVAALVPPRIKEEARPGFAARETVGDVLIYLSTVIILVWWDGFWVEYLAKAHRPNILMSLILVILVTVPFAIFYLAPRMALLREDYAHGQTWINAAIVMAPLAWRLVL